MKTSIPKFEQLPKSQGRHQLDLTIAGMSTPIYWQVGQSSQPQPCAAVTAMVHGDEFEGFVAAMEIWKWANTIELHGSLMVIPVCNPAAAMDATRHTPDRFDGLNLARTFPGSSQGSFTEQLAHAIWNLIRETDVLIDLHSGGVGYDYARLAGYYRDQDAQLSALFPKALVWSVPPTPGVLSYEFSRLHDKISLGWECGGEARLDRKGAEDYATGIKRVLTQTGVAHGTRKRKPQFSNRCVGHTQSQVINSDGWFLPLTTVGATVEQGQIIGQWICPDLARREIVSQYSGTVIALRTLPRVQAGDYLILLAETN